MLARSLSSQLAHLGENVWLAHELSAAAGATLASGHPALDAQLPGAGWPVGSLSEILQPQAGLHEWRLLLPALKLALQQKNTPGPVVLVGAPHTPFAPGLQAQGLNTQRLLWVNSSTASARLWATEQALRCASVAAVLAWLPQVNAAQLRRLQMAASTYSKPLFVMRPTQARNESSPAVLRLLVGSSPADADTDSLQVEILKRRGPPLTQVLTLPARPAPLAVLLALGTNNTSTAANDTAAAAKPEPADALACLATAA
jgi:protein ImuA